MSKGMIVLAITAASFAARAYAEDAALPSTRILDPAQHRRQGPPNYPFRAEPHLGFVLRQLDLRPGDAVVDVGAGDGFWTEAFAKAVGENGTVWSAEVSQKLVDKLAARFAGAPQVKARLIPTDRLDLPDRSADLLFFSLVYHHLPDDRTDYLRGLRQAAKPTGRLAIIERYSVLLSDPKVHGAPASKLLEAAEAAGWVLIRYELMPGTNHYLAIFAQKDLFDEDKPPPPRKDPAREKSPSPPSQSQ